MAETPTNPVQEALLARRSGNARALAGPGPDAAVRAAIVLAAARAPDHGRLVPFRFLEIADDGRERLADLLAAAALELEPHLAAAEIERAREKAHQGPTILALVARIDADHPKITASDQWLAVGCALENMLLSAQGFGFAAAIRSGRFLDTRAMREGFALARHEHLAALVALGTPTDWPPQRPKPTLTEVFSRWPG
ncbi:nitroreductase family protein [Rhabdaerophilum calidifontis]|uniref:nitroreductase family protein n=1 Tax=Rhabdaerophilum calidifontis TaxID=2604328 RepID=UPI0014081B7B|nr:nitroreductase family protein [Rhabdaerophilum calidifontis]